MQDALSLHGIQHADTASAAGGGTMSTTRAEGDQCLERVDGQDSSCDSCVSPLFCSTYRREAARTYESRLNSTPTFVELFSGAGGLSLGFEQEGFLPHFAIDHDINSVETYRFNRPWLPPERVCHGDIREHFPLRREAASLSDAVDIRPDVLLGGVPCQAFSTANRQPLENDPRTELYRHFIWSLEELRPRVVVVENVLGIRRIAKDIISAFARSGYHVEYRVVNAVDFGLPQNRRRVFFIGCRQENPLVDGHRIEQVFDVLTQIGEATLTHVLQDALLGLRPLEHHPEPYATDAERAESGFSIDRRYSNETNRYLRWINAGQMPPHVFNHRARYNNERDVEIFRRLPAGAYSDHPSIKGLMPYESRSEIFRDKFYRLRLDAPCKTITAHMKFDCHMYIHPEQARGLTPREAARVQGFPDSYIFRGAFTRWYEQVGNAVPPPLARAIARAIREVFGFDQAAGVAEDCS